LGPGGAGGEDMVMKAQAYSMIAVLIAVPLFLFISFYITTSQTIRFGSMERVVADQERELMNGIEDDFERAVVISGKRAVLSAINEIINEGEYLINASAALQELMLNGTLYGNYSFILAYNTLNDWKEKILDVPSGFDVSIAYQNPRIENHDGINIKAITNLSAVVSDKMELSEIQISGNKAVLVSMIGLEDPIFPMNTLGLIERTINEYPYDFYADILVTGNALGNCSGNVSFDKGSPDGGDILVTENASGVSGFAGVVAESSDLPDLSCYIVGAAGAVAAINETIAGTEYESVYLDQKTGAVWSLPINEGIQNGYYYSSSGPDMLQRIEGNLSGGGNGMESFVILPELQAVGMEVKQEDSMIDYLYFSGQSINGYQVRGLPDWFRIDAANAERYGLAALLVS